MVCDPVKELKFSLPFPPSSNGCFKSFVKGKKILRAKTTRYNDWIKSSPDLSGMVMQTPVFIKYTMYFPNDAIRDGQSYLKPMLDYIVKQEILDDDNRRIVKGETWWDGGIDRENPRIEVEMRTLTEWN